MCGQMQCSRQLWARKVTLAKARRQINYLNKNVEKSQDDCKPNNAESNPGFFQRKAIFKRPVIKIPSLTTHSTNNDVNTRSIFDESNKESIITASKSRKNLSKGLLPSDQLESAFWERRPYIRQAEWLFTHKTKSNGEITSGQITSGEITKSKDVDDKEAIHEKKTNDKEAIDEKDLTREAASNEKEAIDETLFQNEVSMGSDVSKSERRERSFPVFMKEVLSRIPDASYASTGEDNISIMEQIDLIKSKYKMIDEISYDSLKEAERLINYYPGIERKERMEEVQKYKHETFESLIEKGILHDQIQNVEFDEINLLIKQRALDGNLSDCLEILNKMKVYGLNPSVQTYNNVLLCTCMLRNPKSARFIYLKMIAESLTPDLKTFSILIKTHVLAKDLNSAFALQRKMERDGISSDVVVFSILIDGLVNGGYIERAWETYNYARTWRLIEPDQVLFTIMIKACYKNGEAERALNLYDEMVSLGLHPTDLTYITLIKAMGKRKGFMDKAFHFYNLMKCQEMPITKSVYQHLLKCCGRNGVNSRAELVLKEYRNAGFKLEETDLYHLIMSMKKGAKVKGLSAITIRKVFGAIKSAADEGLRITSITLNGLIELYQSGGFYKYAVQVLEVFPHFNASPNQYTYEIILRFLGNDLKEPGMFFNLWRLMRDNGVVPSNRMMCLALKVALLSGSSKMTLAILREMYSLRIFPTPALVTELYRQGKHIVEIHLAIKDLEQLQKNLVEQKCKREMELLQTYVDERQLSSFAHGKKLNQQTLYHKLRSKTFKQDKLKL